MINVLITGANGFIGENICHFLEKQKNIKVFKGTRNTINLFSIEDIENYINQNKINFVIHCAIEGGHRLKEDNCDIVYKNILMFQNLISFYDKFKCFINIGSGAEYDRALPINNFSEELIFNKIPKDYYGFSKNIISRLSTNYNNLINLRLFGCFYYNELSSRFIKSNIIRYKNKEPMILDQNKFFDYFYLEDMLNIILYFINNIPKTHIDINLCYKDKLKLNDILNKINKLSNYEVEIITKHDTLGNDYTGNSSKLYNLNLNFKGLDFGITDCYNKLI